MELEKQIDDLKIAFKAWIAAFILIVPLTFFDAWVLQTAWNEWMLGTTNVSLTYTRYVGIIMFAKLIWSIFSGANSTNEVVHAKDIIVGAFGKRLGMIIMLGLFSLIWMILI